MLKDDVDIITEPVFSWRIKEPNVNRVNLSVRNRIWLVTEAQPWDRAMPLSIFVSPGSYTTLAISRGSIDDC